VVDAMDGTGAAMFAFLDWTSEKGLLTDPNVKAIKVGAKEVLEQAEGEGWESTDLRTLDVDDVVRRFEIKSATRYTPKSLAAYGQRFRNAMNMYRGFLADPGNWRPSRPRKSLAPRRQTNGDRPQVKVTLPATAPSPATEEPHERPDMMTFPHPIRRGNQTLYARLILPHDLTMKEAEKIGQHIKTLAIEDPPDPPTDAPAAPDPELDSEPEPSTPESPSDRGQAL
jgi:hypothetical protein